MNDVIADHSGPTMFFSGIVSEENVNRVFKEITKSIKDYQINEPETYCDDKSKGWLCFKCNGSKVFVNDFGRMVESFKGTREDGTKSNEDRIDEVKCMFDGNGSSYFSIKRAKDGKFGLDYVVYGGDLSGWMIDLKEKGIEDAFYAESGEDVYRIFEGKDGIEKSFKKCEELATVDVKDLIGRTGKKKWNIIDMCKAGVVVNASKKDKPGITCDHLDMARDVLGKDLKERWWYDSELLQKEANRFKAIEKMKSKMFEKCQKEDEREASKKK